MLVNKGKNESSTLSIMNNIWCLYSITQEALFVFIGAITKAKHEQVIIKTNKRKVEML